MKPTPLLLVASTLAGAMLGGLAEVALAQEATPAASVSPAEPATASLSGHAPAPPPGMSEVVFFRSGALAGSGVWIKVRENGQELGKLSNQTYFATVLDPGPHTFTSAYELQDKLKLELDPDEIYYVRGTLQSCLLLVSANLALADSATFEKHYGHMRLVKSASSETSKDAATSLAK